MAVVECQQFPQQRLAVAGPGGDLNDVDVGAAGQA
jgi:hypothetical protein